MSEQLAVEVVENFDKNHPKGENFPIRSASLLVELAVDRSSAFLGY